MSGAPTMLLDGLQLSECPRWHDGKLWLSEIFGGRVLRVEDGRPVVVATFDDRPAGLGFMPDGTLLVALTDSRTVVRLAGDGRVSLHADLTVQTGDYINELLVDDAGRAYVGCCTMRKPEAPHFPHAEDIGDTIVLIEPDGSQRVVAEHVIAPNGMAISPDGRTLIVAEIPIRALTAFTIADDGSLSDRRIFAETGEHAPDGICLDRDGGVWIGSPFTQQFVRFAATGEQTDAISVGDRFAVACVLGGEDRRTLFMCTSYPEFENDALKRVDSFVETVRVEIPGAGRP